MHPEFRTFLASAYALKGDVGRVADALAEGRRLVGDDRYFEHRPVPGHLILPGVPQVRDLAEITYFAGLRKAEVPEE